MDPRIMQCSGRDSNKTLEAEQVRNALRYTYMRLFQVHILELSEG